VIVFRENESSITGQVWTLKELLARSIMSDMEKMSNNTMPAYKLGDMICINSGPFNRFLGKIEGTNQAQSLLKSRLKFSATRALF
jgi:transcription antitermination factor NusG